MKPSQIPVNPYNPQETAAEALPIEQLTRQQRRLLVRYLEYRDRPMTLPRLIRDMLPGWMALAVLFAALGGLLSWVVSALAPPWPSTMDVIIAVVAGMYLGATARDVGIARRVAAAWPVLSEVIDWQKLTARLDANE